MFEISRSALVIFGFELHWYGLLIALGVLAAVLLACGREKRFGFEADTVLNVVLIAVPAAIICARLYYVLFSWEYYAAHPREILNIRQGGLAIYGGLIGGLLTGWIYCRVRKLSFLAAMDLVAPSLALGQAIGRWGNFFNQEAYGAAVPDPKLQFFPLAVHIEGSGWHWATFFYESLWCALIVAFILLAQKKNFFRRRGDAFGAYLLLYGLERALVEGLRTDSLYLGPIRVSQLLSLALVLFVCIVLARRERKGLIRLIPALSCILLGAALAVNAGWLGIILAVNLIGFSGAIYKGNQNSKDA